MNCYLCGKNKVHCFRKINGKILNYCKFCSLIYDVCLKKKKVLKGKESGKNFLKEYLLEKYLYKLYFEKIIDLIGQKKKRGNLLDIGCGAGVFLEIAKKRGWDIIGIEQSAAAFNYLKKINLKVINKKFENVKLYNHKFDVITIFQTIEHMVDPLTMLKKVKSLLKPRGLIFLTTPNRESVLGRLMGKHWFGYHNEEHIYFFNKKSLKFTLKKSGFNNITIYKKTGRNLTLSWVLTRLIDYYYIKKPWIQKPLILLRSLGRFLDKVKIREKEVDLLAIAYNNRQMKKL